MKWVWFDMDGTISNLYGVPNWLQHLKMESPYPYFAARPLLRLTTLARQLHKLQRAGYCIGVISWGARESSAEYFKKTADAKRSWLTMRMPSVEWDAIKIVPYGRDKWEECGCGILFDDEAHNRETWQGAAYPPEEIMQVLSGLLKK